MYVGSFLDLPFQGSIWVSIGFRVPLGVRV